MISREFNNYIIYHQQKTGSHELVTINCFYDNETVGYIHFYDEDVPDPEVLSHRIIQVNFGMDRFMEIVHTIRYEKPLFLSISDGKGILSTIKEPVGEQEGHNDL